MNCHQDRIYKQNRKSLNFIVNEWKRAERNNKVFKQFVGLGLGLGLDTLFLTIASFTGNVIHFVFDAIYFKNVLDLFINTLNKWRQKVYIDKAQNCY